jgi:flagellar hook-associated protein 2
LSTDLLSSLNKNGSGLNLRDLAQTLATAETAPKMGALQAKVDRDTLRLSALSQIRGQFDQLQSTLRDVAANPVLTVTTSSAAIMPRVTDRAALTPGNVPIDVQALATRQVLEFTGLPAGASTLDAGTMTVEFGAWNDTTFNPQADRTAVTLTIAAGTTLDEFAAQLTEISGVTARVLAKGDGSVSLGIVGETGAQNGLRLTAAGTGGGDIALSSFDTTAANADRQVQAAADARVLVDGIAISRPDNLLRDVLPGMEITLSAAMSGSLEVGRDSDTAAGNVQTLIGALNDTFALLRSMTQRGMGTGTAGDLAGDRSVESLEQSLRRLIATPIAGYGGRDISLADLGIATQRDGLLRFDPPAFDRSFALRAADFDALFTDMLRPLTAGVTTGGQPPADLPAGDYSFTIDAQGIARLDGSRLTSFDLGDGRRSHIAETGPFRGLTFQTDAGVTDGTVQFGRSFAQSLSQLLVDVGSGSGALNRREAEIGSLSEAATAQMDTLQARAAVLEKRYLTKFAAMEQVITQMNGTGSYIQNIVDLWSRDN